MSPQRHSPGDDLILIHNMAALLERIACAGAASDAFRCREACTGGAVQVRQGADFNPMGLDRAHRRR